ncbi:endonuclease [Candidatus Berkelbacteria bacterium CG08_land_8_20_14_0_20_39_8]|uniref:Endonuclease n=1 Tax=Candidatus Berkelbacteria bacterium CG08_land_8_20_14_0_20_39_8 TaxID=1974511 RepID=A0A2M6YCN7_9BACT|nr:MAG: endonuclease [Candidatus Berkelbacteria bacterium CG08_land_8_20_14_0_20_39_8]
MIENQDDHSLYISFSANVDRRIVEHISKIGGYYTKKKFGNWKLLYVEGYINRFDALKREKYLKSGSGRKYPRKQLSNYFNNTPR